MNSYTFIKDYKLNDLYRASFNELAKHTFQIDFEPWYQLGFWNDRYVCYSYLDGNKIVANVSISKMDMVIEGQLIPTIQIGTVMTHANYRKQGLAGSLMTKVIADYEQDHDLFFLFSNETVTNFYQKYGFTQVQETLFTVPIQPVMKNKQLRKLTLHTDKQLLLEYYEKKKSSCHFDIEEGEHVLGFYATYSFSDNLYYIEELDTVVIFNSSDETLHLYAVFSDQEILFYDLIGFIAAENTTNVSFHFTPDFKDLNANMNGHITNTDIFHVRASKVNLPKYFKFPLIAHA